MNRTYIFKIHSIVDVITNSSTVIFTNATKSTVDAFKKLIDATLKLGGSTLTSNDLFDISLNAKDEDEDSYRNDTEIKVSIKETIDESLAKTAKDAIEGLIHTYDIDSTYDG